MTNPRLDRIDLKILARLQRTGRMTNVMLSEAVGLSASPCLLRVKRLEKAGFITGYGAHIDFARLGETMSVFTEVTLQDHKLDDFSRFEAEMRGIEELVECHLVSGGYDYLLKFVTRGVAHYQELIEGLLSREIGIVKYFSYIVIKSPIAKPYPPVAVLFGPQR